MGCSPIAASQACVAQIQIPHNEHHELVDRGACADSVWWGWSVRCCQRQEAKACCVFPSPLREAVAHFAHQNARSTNAVVSGSDNGIAHASADLHPQTLEEEDVRT